VWGMSKAGHRPPTAWLLRLGEHAIGASDRVGWVDGGGLECVWAFVRFCVLIVC